MSHVTLRSGYTELVDRLNRFPQGAPPSDTLYKILEILFSEREARIVSQLPIKPFTAEKASRILKMDLTETRKTLDELAGRAILVDTERDGETTYILPPPMAGFFEFSMMRLRGDVDQKVLGELFYQYLNVEEEFIRDLFVRGETQLGRVFVHEPVLSTENALHVLDYERASEVIRTATHRGIGVCYCRHKMMHVDRSCDAPMEICMTFNGAADSLIRHGYARPVDVSEGLELLRQAYERQPGAVRGERARARQLHLQLLWMLLRGDDRCPQVRDAEPCAHLQLPAGRRRNPVQRLRQCVVACPVEAMSLVSANDGRDPEGEKGQGR